MPERTSELWNCSGVMPVTRLAIEAVNSAVVSRFDLDETLAVPTILVDVPDREDVLLVADADLEVCFFINPTPLPDPFSTLGRNAVVAWLERMPGDEAIGVISRRPMICDDRTTVVKKLVHARFTFRTRTTRPRVRTAKARACRAGIAAPGTWEPKSLKVGPTPWRS